MEEKLHIFNKKFATDSSLKNAIIRSMVHVIKNNKLEPDMSDYELNLILDEAVTNAMEHGNRWDPDKGICVEMFHLNHFLYVTIEDEGEGFDSNSILSERDNSDSIMSARGRGLKIISGLTCLKWEKSGKKINLKIHLKK